MVWPDFVDSQILDTQFCPQCPALSEKMVRFIYNNREERGKPLLSFKYYPLFY